MAQFPLKMKGAEVCTLEDLKKNFNPADLVSYRNRFAAWLKGWDYDEEAVAVKALDQNLSDEEWLPAICEIIGISDQELEASRKKVAEVAKQEQKKVEKQQAEEQKRKAEQERKKKLDPTPQNIYVDINNRKSPFCDVVSTVFSCEKGIIINTKSDQLYFSNDGEKFTPFHVNSNSYHYYKDFCYLGEYLFFRDGDTIYYSKNGEDWDSFEFESVIPKQSKDWDSPYYRRSPTFSSIVYDSNTEKFVIFYYFIRDVVNDDIMQVYCCATAKYPDCSWTDWGEINFPPFNYPNDFYFFQGKYFTRVNYGDSKYGYDHKTDDGVYFSKDGLNWKKAEASDQEWLDGLEYEMGSRWIHIDYCNCKDGLKRYFIEEGHISPWGKIYFSYNDRDVIRAWKEGYEKQDVSDECDFSIKTTVCFNGKLLIFGENNEFAIGEISVNGSKQRKSLPAKPPKKKIPRKPQPTQEEAILNRMNDLSKSLEALSKIKFF